MDAALSAKRLVRSLFLRAGLDLHRLTPAADPYVQLHFALKANAIDLVLDVGANTGQFAAGLRRIGYAGGIVSFEPLSAAHAKLAAAAKDDASWAVHPQCAIGDEDGEIEINVAGNSVSSSVLPMTDTHAAAAPGSAYVGRERVRLARLDSVAGEYLAGSAKPFLKIDTQGFEWQVLEGARETLPKLKGILCEMSLVPLYAGQRLWKDTLAKIESEGFSLWALQTGFTDPKDGRTLQMDGIFFRAA
jgi:FkbM family methyltransferase